MKKAILLVFSFYLLVSLSSCDKIEQDNYWVYAGASGTWYDTDEDIPAVQCAFIEKYTGVRCPNCPRADVVLHEALEKYGDRLAVVAIHAGSHLGKPYGTDEDLRTEDGNTWFDYFGVNTQPAALVMRPWTGTAWNLFTPTANFDDKIDAVLGDAPAIGLKMESLETESDDRSVDLFVSFEREVTDSLTLTVLIVEDKILTTQLNGSDKVENYEQNHVLRKIITDPWGIDVDAKGLAGEKRTLRLYFPLESHWKPEDCTLVAFVSDKASRRILNVTRTQL